VTLRRSVTIVGRSNRLCDLPLDNKSVSKLHCILVKTDGLIYMRDLGSTNGTRVNGQRVLRGALLPGDQISFSGSEFKIHLAPDSEAESGIQEANPHAKNSDLDAPMVETDSDSDGWASESDVRLLSDEDLALEE